MTHLWEVVDVATKKHLTTSTSNPSSKTSTSSLSRVEERIKKNLSSSSDKKPPIPSTSSATNSQSLQQQNSKRNLLDGFRTSLSRPRARSDNEASAVNSASNRRWSETDSPTIGSVVRALVDFQDDQMVLSTGDRVRVVATDKDKGFRVVLEANSREGWVPAYVLLPAENPRKPTWTFRKPRKSSYGGKPEDDEDDFSSRRHFAAVVCRKGDAAVLKCEKPAGVSVRWRRQGLHLVGANKKHSFEHDDHLGVAVLYITDCCRQDAGKYECVQQGMEKEKTALTTEIMLYVRGE